MGKERNVSFDGNTEIENNFMYHKPKDDQSEKYEALRAKAKEFAYLVDDLCPGGKEREISMVKLEESVMWANAAIARS